MEAFTHFMAGQPILDDKHQMTLHKMKQEFKAKQLIKNTNEIMKHKGNLNVKRDHLNKLQKAMQQA